MKAIKWIAGNGKEIVVFNKTKEQNIADHTVINKCDEIAVTLDDRYMIYQGLTSDGMIQLPGVKVRIPEELKKEVIEMINGVSERRQARLQKSIAAEKEYAKHYNKINRMV